ncbi:MAG: phosphate propanoyltransferase [Oscillospiraceae bacterium]|nr:phosphate propanoyltransferase [Oscillospiraceae bacterium]
MNAIPVETSARHVHLTEKDVAALFGEGHSLTFKKMLSQPGQFACEERVDIIGPKKEIKNVIILGPVRSATQVEVSLTDSRTLGVDAPVRESGDLAGSAACTIAGPAGKLEIKEGLIAAKRHVHLRPEDAEKIGVRDKEIVQVKIKSENRGAILGDTIVRVNADYMPFMHIDTDEANACGAAGIVEGEIIK